MISVLKDATEALVLLLLEFKVATEDANEITGSTFDDVLNPNISTTEPRPL